MSTLSEEISRRRTFAIISHPDAGKTTLTEKFLLYGGAIAQAGVVKGKKNRIENNTCYPYGGGKYTGFVYGHFCRRLDCHAGDYYLLPFWGSFLFFWR